MDTTRVFYVETPLGKLKAESKHVIDSAEDYPGIIISFICGDGEEKALAMTEFDPVANNIATRVYGNLDDESPTDSVVHEGVEKYSGNMTEYTINIVEKTTTSVTVMARSEEEAVSQVSENHGNGQYDARIDKNYDSYDVEYEAVN